jgi:hypothetical protein
MDLAADYAAEIVAPYAAMLHPAVCCDFFGGRHQGHRQIQVAVGPVVASRTRSKDVNGGNVRLAIRPSANEADLAGCETGADMITRAPPDRIKMRVGW